MRSKETERQKSSKTGDEREKKTLSIIEHQGFSLLYETRLHIQFIIFYLEDVQRPVKPSKMKYVSCINCEYSVFFLSVIELYFNPCHYEAARIPWQAQGGLGLLSRLFHLRY